MIIIVLVQIFNQKKLIKKFIKNNKFNISRNISRFKSNENS